MQTVCEYIAIASVIHSYKHAHACMHAHTCTCIHMYMHTSYMHAVKSTYVLIVMVPNGALTYNIN